MQPNIRAFCYTKPCVLGIHQSSLQKVKGKLHDAFLALSCNWDLIFSLVPSLSNAAVFAPDPRRAPIIPGQECLIEIPKGTTGLGLSIVGGADTLLVSNNSNTISCSSVLDIAFYMLFGLVFIGSYCYSRGLRRWGSC